ncbi:MAG: IS3 family transposase [Proteobacteria bacterium]|nr:IS3 family transposase [Pseudomonadota bacterium]
MTKNNDQSHSCEDLCQEFDVSVPCFYKWQVSQNKDMSSRKDQVKIDIKHLFDESNGTYGSPGIFHILKSSKKLISKKTVAKYMKEMGLNANYKKKESALLLLTQIIEYTQ